MKKHFYVLSIVVLLITAFNVSTVKAEGHRGENPPPTTQLPINGGLVFLAIAGTVIGVTTLKKANTLKATTVKS